MERGEVFLNQSSVTFFVCVDEYVGIISKGTLLSSLPLRYLKAKSGCTIFFTSPAHSSDDHHGWYSPSTYGGD